ncbi:SDR family NAD(P)-dependent oxidoreductase [Aliikangiella coralliicola]|uniref:SDR family NAD(P)-dependent oxidoreductase n=1 Tax=Aliikangiella coralliicola TaxID=2592383 RepID=A0A545U9B4_9GAMM|nr:SDR family NAD(P)-dependent oxidoreductase [Aliikangiella coralliicola]TQV86003.1 SDR family NAD(P)-dependent oxidoreductase [Aliikangiella coralliicola]
MEQMNDLKNIYRDLSQGKLTQQQALEKIKAIKLKQKNASGILLATPVWEEDASVVSNSLMFNVEQHCVLLCHLPKLNRPQLKSDLPASQVVSVVQSNKDIAADYSELALSCFEQIQSILKSRPKGPVLFQVVAADNGQMTMLSGLSGLLKTAMLENPQLIAQVVFTDVVDSAEKLTQQLQDAGNYPQETLIRYQQNERKFLHWQEVKATEKTEVKETALKETAFKDSGTYLITGGLGGLGKLMTREILQQTRHGKIIVTGRSPLTAEKQSILDDFSALNTQSESRVEYRQLDIENQSQVESLIASINTPEASLKGIIHCSGMTADNFIIKKSSEEFRQVLAPKVLGTYHLDQASRDLALDFFVLFSSAASWLGNVGQSDYAAANGFMDQFSAYRNQLVAQGDRQGKSLSVNWSLWREGGMEIEPSMLSQIEQNTGAVQLETASGLGAFYRGLQLPYSQFSVTEGNIQKLRVALLENTSLQQVSSKDEIANVTTQLDNEVVSHAPSAKYSQQNFQESTEGYLCKQFSKLLKLPSHKIDAQAPLEKYGIDSIMAMNLTSQLEKAFGSLPKTLFFEYQTIAELAQYFVRSHLAKVESLFITPIVDINQVNTPTNELKKFPAKLQSLTNKINKSKLGRRYAKQSQSPTLSNKTALGQTQISNAFGAEKTAPIAIIGLSGRYPEAPNIEAYWQNLRDGKDCIVEVPQERWDWQQYYSEDRAQKGKHFSKWGGFIVGVDEFDSRFFNISPREAKSIDPQERLFLQHAWMAVEDAGYTRTTLQIPHQEDAPGQVGVYVGVMYGEYSVSGSLASIANRVSYVLNLHGPSMTLDTMCSSSLTAIHLACQDLKLGRTDLAIAGGVNVSIHPGKYQMLSAEQFISSAGHCQSFGEGGDGYIPGEGVGAVILKRLSQAEQDGNHIYGVIKGSALNHGGKTNGYSVPNPGAQANAITRALAEAEIDSRHISYIEAHGTGTKLGDPIEIAALTKAFNQNSSSETEEFGFCLIGSAKSNVGHCESAAGVAGVTKVLLQMKHQKIVPSLHSAKLNPHIDFDNTPFIVNQTLKAWQPPVIDGRQVSRIAGVSSFGAGGSNAHIIIEEYSEQEHSVLNNQTIKRRQDDSWPTKVIVLSARTEAQLRQKCSELIGFIECNESSIDLHGMAYTLQVGREAMGERLGLIVSSLTELSEKLNAFISGAEDIEDLYLGKVKDHRETLSLFSSDNDMQRTLDKWITDRKLTKLLDLWVKGLALDWNKLYEQDFSQGIQPQLISLPTYPFAQDKYWIDPLEVSAQIVSGQAISGDSNSLIQGGIKPIHPVLHTNTSDLFQQSYQTSFSGKEFFFQSDFSIRHQSNQKVLPTSVYIEMARAAIENAMPDSEAFVLELHDIVWAQPIVVEESRSVSIALLAKDKEQIDFEIYNQEQDVVHCQGHGVLSRNPAPTKLDLIFLKKQLEKTNTNSPGLPNLFNRNLTSIYAGNNQLLAELTIGDNDRLTTDYVLHPNWLDAMLQALLSLTEGSQSAGLTLLPLSLSSIRIIFPGAKKMFAWIRFSNEQGSANAKLDIDWCDEHGNVCIQVKGAEYAISRQAVQPRQNLPVVDDESESNKKTAEANSLVDIGIGASKNVIDNSLSKKIELTEIHSEIVQIQTEKPQGITLTSASKLVTDSSNFIEKSPTVNRLAMSESITLSNAVFSDNKAGSTQGEMNSSQAMVNLYNNGNGIYTIKINQVADGNVVLSERAISELKSALEIAQQESQIKILLLKGTDDYFLSGEQQSHNSAIEQKLYQKLVEFPYPVIAVMKGSATKVGFLVGALCDFMICSEEASYQYADFDTHSFPSAAEQKLLVERFDMMAAEELLDGKESIQGTQLRANGWSCLITPKVDVDLKADKLAQELAEKPQQALKLLKLHLARNLIELVAELTPVSQELEKLQSESDKTTAKQKSAIASPVKYIRLSTHNDNILIVRILQSKKKFSTASLIGYLSKIFSQVNQNVHYKAVILASEHAEFLPQAEKDKQGQLLNDFQTLLLSIATPVIVAFEANASALAMAVAQLCDGIIYHDKGKYSFASNEHSVDFLTKAEVLLSHRFGDYSARNLLLAQSNYSGVELKQRHTHQIIVDKKQVIEQALELAGRWSQNSLSFLTAKKKRSNQIIQEKIKQIPLSHELNTGLKKTSPVDKPTLVELQSSVVSATTHPEGILVVKMEDRKAKNMFSDALVEGMNEVFAHIDQSPDYKVIVLTGYDSYFSSGGTKESLLDIQQGKSKFTDTQTFQLAMKCRLPVIAAMQGHGIGAGFALGLFADFVLLSEESHYVSPYMNYGFTPGAAATFISPLRMGYDLARESLLTAREYEGKALQTKGLQLSVLPRQKVLSTAIDLARQIARYSQSQLMALKHQWTYHLHQPLQDTCALELAMHDETFVGESNTLKQIQKNFFDQIASRDDVPQLSATATARAVEEKAVNLTSTANTVNKNSSLTVSMITAAIKKLLADELHMDVAEAEEDAQFVDLGLDSITGVTWVRKINDKYQTTIEATKVYSFPTLTEFAKFVKTEIDAQADSSSQSEIQTQSRTAAPTVTVAKSVHTEAAISNVAQDSQVAEAADEKTIEINSVNINSSQVTTTLKKLLADELHMSTTEIDEDAQFVDLGLDSITGVTWVRKINDKYQLSIEATRVYSYPTLKEFSTFVQTESVKTQQITDDLSAEIAPETVAQVGRNSDAQVKGLPPTRTEIPNVQQFDVESTYTQLISWRKNNSKLRAESRTQDHTQPIAVIGMAGQFPQANDLDEFWDNIASAKNCITSIPSQRWDLDTYYQEGAPTPGKTNSQWVGAMDGYDLFDPLFFTISPTEAETMEPQQRVFLQACWHTIEDAGYNAQALSGSRCGVFVGCAAGDYNLLSREQQISAQGFTGGAASILGARISYFLNLQGPCLSIDTACSSSLVAIANACDSLNSAGSDLALAGGVYVMAGPDMHIKSSQAGMLSTDGRCFAFDQRANGFVPGEGVGVVMLKRLADAERDQDIIQGVIKGWGVNQDGKTNGITAPNADSQTRLQQEVYDKFKIDPANIQLIEAHGTGTKLGDPIEVAGLKESFKKYTDKKDYCALGSVKSNIGHCLTAAAVAGLIKLILAMKHKQLPPTINFEKVNEHIGLDNSPFYINDKLQPWEVSKDERRQAAISSFGFSGTNAHMVIAEYSSSGIVNNQVVKKAVDSINENGKLMIPLSARNEEQLFQIAGNLLQFISKQKASIQLSEVAYTLQVGREPMEERVGFMVNSIEHLIEKLEVFVSSGKDEGVENIEDAFRGQVRGNKESMRIISQDDDMKNAIIQNWMSSRKLSKLLDLWVKGLDLDWNKLYGKLKPQRINLPTYPFARERYWLEKDVVATHATAENSSNSTEHLNNVLHPLLHINTAELTQQGYRANFANDEQHQLSNDDPANVPSAQRVRRVSLPTYPFAKERCWIDVSAKEQNIETATKPDKLRVVKNLESIENIINKVDDDSIETNQAVKLLKNLA